jgi:hypothetical protein
MTTIPFSSQANSDTRRNGTSSHEPRAIDIEHDGSEFSKTHINELNGVGSWDQGVVSRTDSGGNCVQYFFNLPGEFMAICNEVLDEGKV